MTGLAALWLPILVSAVLVFVASSVIHMALPWHKGDYRQVPGEEKLVDAVRSLAIPPGDYMVPHAGGLKEAATPEFKAKLEKGPVLIMTVRPNGPVSMTGSLVSWFVYCAAVGLFSAYVAGRGLPPGTPYPRVFQLAGATAFLCYAVGLWQNSIWLARSWATTFRQTVDGLVYALLTGGVFGWLWPR